MRFYLIILILFYSVASGAQSISLERFVSDSTMKYGRVSFCLIDTESGQLVSAHNASVNLIPASVLKLVTTSAAIELLGPEYTFRTILGYTGELNKRSGKLTGDIIIRGGGDPCLGSSRFAGHYGDFVEKWTAAILKLGIKKIEGRVITDDSYYDYQPVPVKWLWEDAGNYYGAGAYGLSVYDNTYEIHFESTADSLGQRITGITPVECDFEFMNWLVAAGTADEGYVFAAPYSTNGWLAGTIPANPDDFVLKASIADPPRLMARIIDRRLRDAGVGISGEPTTTRLMQRQISSQVQIIDMLDSPSLKEIIKLINYESVNLYAEHLVKELGKKFLRQGSTEAGIKVIYEFLSDAGVEKEGFFLEDGSGVSPVNGINSMGVAKLLCHMNSEGTYREYFLGSLPSAGKDGTLLRYFRDPEFESRMTAKSGSMTRVRSYAGYLKTLTGRDLAFSIIVNNFTGPSTGVVRHIEAILKEAITSN